MRKPVGQPLVGRSVSSAEAVGLHASLRLACTPLWLWPLRVGLTMAWFQRSAERAPLQATAVTTPTSIASPVTLRRAIEATWLLAAGLIPIAILDEGFMLGWIQMPKVFVLRTLALVLVSLVAFEWAFTPRRSRDLDGVGESGTTTARYWLRDHPARLVFYAAIAVLSANVISVIFSPVRSIGIWGIDPGWDTYGLYSVVSYLVFFAVMSTHIRTKAQIDRLIWVLTAASIWVSLYGIGQHFGIDPIRNDPVPVERAGLAFGNPIFGAAYLILTVPLTLAVFMPFRSRMAPITHIWIGSGLIASQLTAIVFTVSRGPLLGFFVGVVAFFAILAWVSGWRQAARPLAIGLVAATIALIMNLLPVANAPSASEAFGERIGSIGTAVAGGLNSRSTIWIVSTKVYFTTPWVDTEQFPEVPELGFRALRPLVGYGPEMFGYAYPTQGNHTFTDTLASHGHNFVVHTAIELGLFGVFAYLGLIVALGIVLFRLLQIARAGRYPYWFTYLLVTLAGVLVTRAAEQIPGKAQISDLHLSWMLAALVVGVAVMAPSVERPGEAAAGSESAPEASQRRGRRVRRGERDPRGSALVGPRSTVHAFAAFSVAILAIVFWFETVASPVRSAKVAADAQAAAQSGRLQEGVDLYNEAIEIAPSSAINKLNLAQLLFDVAINIEDPANSDQRVALLEAAHQQAQLVLERNPLDHRAVSRSGEFLREQAVYQREIVGAAVHENELLVELMPGFWQARTSLAWSLVRLGLYDRALDALQDAKDIEALEAGGAQLIHFVEAVALEALGRTDGAIRSAQLSMEASPNSQAQEVLDRLLPPG